MGGVTNAVTFVVKAEVELTPSDTRTVAENDFTASTAHLNEISNVFALYYLQ